MTSIATCSGATSIPSVGECAMKRKYCPTCFLEHHEQVKIIPHDIEKDSNRRLRGIKAYRCVKRGHVIKGAGLTLAELKELEKFYG